MNRLSKAQIDYASNRIQAAATRNKADAKKKLTTGERLTAKRRATLLRQGKVKLSSGVTEISSYTDVTDVFDFSKFEEKTDEKKYNAECNKIDNEMRKLMDELMLGDTQRALEIISAL